MAGSAGDPIVDVRAKMQCSARRSGEFGPVNPQFDADERRVFDDDPDLLHRRNQEVIFALPLEHGGEQADQCRPSDRSFQIVPGAVAGDPHVDIAAKWWIPEVNRRRALARGLAGRRNDGVKSLFGLPFVRHCLPGTYPRDRPFSPRSRPRASLSTAAQETRSVTEKLLAASGYDPQVGRCSGRSWQACKEAGSHPVKSIVFSRQSRGFGVAGKAARDRCVIPSCDIWRECCTFCGQSGNPGGAIGTCWHGGSPDNQGAKPWR
jgi:hypothetical protein